MRKVKKRKTKVIEMVEFIPHKYGALVGRQGECE